MPWLQREEKTSVRGSGSSSVWPEHLWGRAASSSWMKPQRLSTWPLWEIIYNIYNTYLTIHITKCSNLQHPSSSEQESILQKVVMTAFADRTVVNIAVSICSWCSSTKRSLELTHHHTLCFAFPQLNQWICVRIKQWINLSKNLRI